jgi:two-component system, cell cycle sensor histidine kinase and response regulator CckA
VPRPFLSGLRERLLLLVLISVLPGFAMTWFAGRESRERLRGDVVLDTVRLARILADDQERVLDGTHQILSELAALPEVQEADARRVRAFFGVLTKVYKGYASFILFDAAGNIVVSLPPADGPMNLSDRPWFQEALKRRRFVVGDYQVGGLSRKHIVVATLPVLDAQDRAVGVLSAGIDVTWLNQVAATAQLPPGAVMMLVDRKGVVVARYPEGAGVPGYLLGDQTLAVQIRQPGDGTIEAAGPDGIRRIYGYTGLKGRVETGLRLVVGIPSDHANAAVQRLQTQYLFALFLIVVLSLGVGWFFAERFVLRYAKSLLEATRQLAAGDPAARTQLPYGHGELSDLARAFDEMASAVQAREAERSEAEQALRRSEERFRTFMDNSPALAFLRGASGAFVYVNATFERVFELAEGEWRDAPDTRFWAPETAQRLRAADLRALETGQPQQAVDTAVLADGRQRHWLTISFALPGSDEHRAVGTMAFDLTDWRAAQRALARAERRFTQLVEHASDGIVLTDASLRLVEVNSAICALTGHAREEMVGRDVADLLLPEDLAVAPIRLDDLRDGRESVGERRLRRKDGSIVVAEISARMAEDGGLQAIVRDVSRRREAEAALRESEERFRLLYQYLPLAYHSLSAHGILVLVNDAWLMLTGYTRGQVIGRRFSELLVPASLEDYDRKFQRPISTADVYNVELTLMRGDHTQVTVLIDGRRGRDEHGEWRVHCALHDVTAARRADARLRESEERYRTLFADSPISLWEEDFSGIRRHIERLRALGVTDLDEHFHANPEELLDCVESVRVVDVNQATLALYGAETRSQLLAGLDRVIGGDGLEVFRHSILALASGARSWSSEGVNYALNGDPIRLALQWSLAPGAEGSWTRVLVSAMDITDRARVEAALRESEARFERVFRSSPGIMGIVRRADRGFLDVNDAFLRELGFHREEVVGRTVEDLGLWRSHDDREEIRALFREHGIIHNQEIQLRRRSGALLHGTFSVVPLRVGGDECLLVQIVDTTARRRAEEESRESQRVLATLMSNLPGMAYQCCNDPAWTMLFVSEGCRELTGYDPADLIGNRIVSFASLIAEEDREAMTAGVREVGVGGGPFRLTYRIRRRDGDIRWVWEQGRVVKAQESGVVTIEGFISDITERKRAEEDLEQSNDLLRQAQKMEAVGRLAGGIAHDFNNLLTAILGYADLVLTRLTPEDPLSSKVEEIRRAGERAANLIRKLLAFSRKQVLAPRVLSLDAVIEEMVPMLRRVIGEDVGLRLRTGRANNVKADPTQMEQVVMNLVVNARDAMPRGGTLTIETSSQTVDEREAAERHVQRGSYSVLSVTDTGVGMDGDTRSRLFEPFFTTKTEGQGTGLGLPTVYGIVQQSGGFVEVRSEVGAGSTFLVFLPEVAEPPDEVSSVYNMLDLAAGTETILLAEDEDAVRRLLTSVLGRLGYSILEARDGLEALEIWREQWRHIDLVITDVVMPRLDGPSLVARILETHPATRVIYLSGYANDAIVLGEPIEPGRPCLQKPFPSGVLARTVRSVLDGRME